MAFLALSPILFNHRSNPVDPLWRCYTNIARTNVIPVTMADPPLHYAPDIHEPCVNRIIVELAGGKGLHLPGILG